MTWTRASLGSSVAAFASATHWCVMSCKADAIWGYCDSSCCSKKRLLKDKKALLRFSTPVSSSCTRLCRLPIVVSFRLRYACCARRSCWRRLCRSVSLAPEERCCLTHLWHLLVVGHSTGATSFTTTRCCCHVCDTLRMMYRVKRGGRSWIRSENRRGGLFNQLGLLNNQKLSNTNTRPSPDLGSYISTYAFLLTLYQ